jgi:adenylate kinase
MPSPGSCSTATLAPRRRWSSWTVQGRSLDAVLELTVDTDEVVQRLLKRAEIDGRADDTEGVIRHRLKVYDEETAPLAALYRGRGLLHQVDGMGEMDAVTERLQSVLATLKG